MADTKVFYFQPIRVAEYSAWLQQHLPELKDGREYFVRQDGTHGVAIEVKEKSETIAHVYVRFLEWSRALKVRAKRREGCSKETLEEILKKVAPEGHKIVAGGEDVDL